MKIIELKNYKRQLLFDDKSIIYYSGDTATTREITNFVSNYISTKKFRVTCITSGSTNKIMISIRRAGEASFLGSIIMQPMSFIIINKRRQLLYLTITKDSNYKVVSAKIDLSVYI